MFILNSSTGDIKLNASLDYEKTTSYIFTVIACDAGTPSLKDKAQVTVNVKDVNDNKPKFSASNFVVNVTESSQINRVVFKVAASDEDSGLNSVLRYSLLSGNTGNTFTIDPITGISFSRTYFSCVCDEDDRVVRSINCCSEGCGFETCIVLKPLL